MQIFVLKRRYTQYPLHLKWLRGSLYFSKCWWGPLFKVLLGDITWYCFSIRLSYTFVFIFIYQVCMTGSLHFSHTFVLKCAHLTLSSTRQLDYESAWLTCLSAADGGEKLLEQFHPPQSTTAHCHSHLTLLESASVTYRKLIIPEICPQSKQSSPRALHSTTEARLLSPC